MSFKSKIKRFWKFLNEDTWQSWLVSLVLLIILIKFIFFPTLSFVTGTSLPLVIVESCSMYHEANFDSWWDANAAWYERKGITKEEFSNFPMKNGLNKGDIILILGRTNVTEGDIIVFNAGSKYPLIHRIVDLDPTGTKGDHNSDQLRTTNNRLGIDETSIIEENIIGEAKLKIIPLVGWIKLIWFEPFKSQEERGFCK